MIKEEIGELARLAPGRSVEFAKSGVENVQKGWLQKLGGIKGNLPENQFAKVVRASAQGDQAAYALADELENVWKMKQSMLQNLMSQGLPSHKIGKKRVFLKEDLIKWIKEH